jgi:hypothetical protein
MSDWQHVAVGDLVEYCGAGNAPRGWIGVVVETQVLGGVHGYEGVLVYAEGHPQYFAMRNLEVIG